MTRLELRTLALSLLDDDASGYFTEPQMNVFLNNAQNSVQKQLINCGQNYALKCVTTTLVVSQRNYELPDDFKKVNRLEVITSGSVPNESYQALTPITLNQQDLMTTGTATPCAYYISKNSLFLVPAPDTALTLRLTYTYLLPDMTQDSDVPDVPEAYHELIALYAARDGFIKDERVSELLMARIKAYEDEFNQDAQERNEDMPRGIVQTTVYSGNGFYY